MSKARRGCHVKSWVWPPEGLPGGVWFSFPRFSHHPPGCSLTGHWCSVHNAFLLKRRHNAFLKKPLFSWCSIHWVQKQISSGLDREVLERLRSGGSMLFLSIWQQSNQKYFHTFKSPYCSPTSLLVNASRPRKVVARGWMPKPVGAFPCVHGR